MNKTGCSICPILVLKLIHRLKLIILYCQWVSGSTFRKQHGLTHRMFPLILFTKQSDCFLHGGVFMTSFRSQYKKKFVRSWSRSPRNTTRKGTQTEKYNAEIKKTPGIHIYLLSSALYSTDIGLISSRSLKGKSWAGASQSSWLLGCQGYQGGSWLT